MADDFLRIMLDAKARVDTASDKSTQEEENVNIIQNWITPRINLLRIRKKSPRIVRRSGSLQKSGQNDAVEKCKEVEERFDVTAYCIFKLLLSS